MLQAIQTINNYKILSSPVTCTDLGMNPNEDNGNLDLLIEGLSKYGTIYVDNMYPIDCTLKGRTEYKTSEGWYLESGKLELIGLRENCGFTIDWGAFESVQYNLFNFDNYKDKNGGHPPIDSIILDNLTFHAVYKPSNDIIDSKGIIHYASETKIQAVINCDIDTLKKIMPKDIEKYHREAYASAKGKAVDELAAIIPGVDDFDKFSSLEKLKYCLKLYNLTKLNTPTRCAIFYAAKSKTNNIIINNFSITNCNFEGNVKCVDIAGSDRYCVIRQGKFNNNRISNCRSAFFTTGDTATDYFEFKNNIFKNFDNSVILWAVDSGKDKEGNTLTGPESASRIKSIIIENNYAICEDNWFHNPYASGVYNVFSQVESDRVVYRNNHVQGMKSFASGYLQLSSKQDKIIRSTVAQYDAYLSSKDVIYENNYWENNVLLFYYANNTLLKAKDSQKVATKEQVWNGAANKYEEKEVIAKPGLRKYHNNTFISTEEFYRKHLYKYWEAQGKSGDELAAKVEEKLQEVWVSFISNTAINDWDIQNNTFDMYKFQGVTSAGPTRNNNLNTVNCGYYGNEKYYGLRFRPVPASDIIGEYGQEALYQFKSRPADGGYETIPENCTPYVIQAKEDDIPSKNVQAYKNFVGTLSSTSVKMKKALEFFQSDEEKALAVELGIDINNDTNYYCNLPINSDMHRYIVLCEEGKTPSDIDANSPGEVLHSLNGDSGADLFLGISALGNAQVNNFGYYFRKFTLKGNKFNLKHMRNGIFSSQREDSEFICENNIFNIEDAYNEINNRSKPYLIRTIIDNEPLGRAVIKNNILNGFSSIFITPNIKECEFHDNKINLVPRVHPVYNTLITPMLFDYYSAEDLDTIETYIHGNSNNKCHLLNNVYGVNNLLTSHAHTYLPVGKCFLELTLTAPNQTTIEAANGVTLSLTTAFIQLKTKNPDTSNTEKTTVLSPNYSIQAEGVTLTTINTGVLAPSVFQGVRYVNGQSYNYGNSYVNDTLLTQSSDTVSLRSPTNTNKIEYVKFTLNNLKA